MLVRVGLPWLRPEGEDSGQQQPAMAPFPGGPRWGHWPRRREVGNTLPLSPGEERARPRARSKCSGPASSEPARRAGARTRWRGSALPTSCSCESCAVGGVLAAEPSMGPRAGRCAAPPWRAPPGGAAETQPHLPWRVSGVTRMGVLGGRQGGTSVSIPQALPTPPPPRPSTWYCPCPGKPVGLGPLRFNLLCSCTRVRTSNAIRSSCYTPIGQENHPPQGGRPDPSHFLQ